MSFIIMSLVVSSSIYIYICVRVCVCVGALKISVEELQTFCQ